MATADPVRNIDASKYSRSISLPRSHLPADIPSLFDQIHASLRVPFLPMDLEKIARPWTDSDGEIPVEWAQGELYGGPLIAKRIEELVARISLFSTGGATVLKMWDPRHQTLDVGKVLSVLELTRDSYAVALAPISRTPVESGYLECMRLTPAKDGVSFGDAVAAFAKLQLERYPDMEKHLIDCYGALTPERTADQRFGFIDYPGFDSGPMALGLGLFAEEVKYRHSFIWCWSRVVNWHK